jgi:hypothetical protein
MSIFLESYFLLHVFLKEAAWREYWKKYVEPNFFWEGGVSSMIREKKGVGSGRSIQLKNCGYVIFLKFSSKLLLS